MTDFDKGMQDALRADAEKLREVLVTMLGAIDKGAVDSEEIGPVPGDGPPYRFHEECAHHARKLLEPTTPNTEDE